MPELDPSRSQRFTASLAPRLMSGSHDVIQRLWLRAIGDPRYEDDGFGSTWAARYGLQVEPMALDWHQEKTGLPITCRGQQFFHPSLDYVSGTLDGFREADNRTIQCKTINAYRDIDEMIDFYKPQCTVERACKQADSASLLIVKGGTEPVEIDVYIDAHYETVVWDTIRRFWDCVLNLTPPVPLHFPRIVPPEKWRRIDLDADAELPNWADDMRELLIGWGNTEESAMAFERIKTDIKALFPDDCGRLTCGPYVVARARNNNVTIKHRKTHG